MKVRGSILALVLLASTSLGVGVAELTTNDDLVNERILIQAWNAYVQSVDLQNDVIKALQDDYLAHNPMTHVYAPDVRKAQRERRLNSWDAVIKEQEIQLQLMKQIREAESKF